MFANLHGNWFQQRLAILIGQRLPLPPPPPVSAKMLADQAAARAQLQADTMAFREEHVRRQGMGDGTYRPDR